MSLQAQLLHYYQRLQPYVIQGKMLSKQAFAQGRLFSQMTLEKGLGRGQYYRELLQAKWAASGWIHQVSDKGGKWIRISLSKGEGALLCLETFISGPVRNNVLILKHLCKEIYAHQDLSPPTFESWTLAKEAYREGWRRFCTTSPFEYTWRQVGYATRLLLELYAFYFVGKSIGRVMNRTVS